MKHQNWMTLWNDTGLRPLSDLRREMDRYFDDYWTSVPSRRSWQSESQFVPACDLEEKPEHYLLRIEMPGVAKNDIKLEVIDRQLIVSGERHVDRKNHEGGAWYSERQFGKFQRTFTLPAGVDTDQVQAEHQDGVLHVLVPKAASAKPRQIKIAGGSPTGFFGKWMGHQSTPREIEERNTTSDPSKAAS